MSNVKHQVVAVVATLLGFLAHDLLSETRMTANPTSTTVAAADIDPVVTRSVDLGDLTLAAITRMPAPLQQAPLAGTPERGATAAESTF